jgi:hypothetical protein
MNRFGPALLIAALSACAGRWESVPITDHRLQRSGARIELAVGGRRERLRVIGVSADGVRARRSDPCDSCEVLIPAATTDSVRLRCGMGAGLIALGGSAAAIAVGLIVIGTNLE